MEGLRLSPLLAVLFFAVLNEALIEYFFGSMRNLKPYLPLIGLTLAILLTFAFNINILRIVLGIETTSSFLDLTFSSFVIARLSNFVNDFAQKILGSK